ncbi:hypothetical protein [Paludibaculum fermentans]|uniref:hypothetical protein n=1 Tax=Paludibaculum fermentans TaxID=1473598 RepID=UPI003EBF874D
MRIHVLIVSFALCAMGSLAQTRPSNVKASNMVLLELTTGAKDGCGPLKFEFVRTLPDGTAETDAYRVPEGRVLVVTDVDWHFVSGPPNQLQVFRLLVQNLGDGAKIRRAFESAVQLNGFGIGGASEHMTTGFVVAPQARICADATQGMDGSVMRLSKVLLRGYLMDWQ